jgi:hypothetical protein
MPTKRRRPRPVSPDERARVAELHAKGWARNAIARDLDRSLSVVTGIARAQNLSFDREQTKAATAAKVADVKALRAQLSLDLLADAQRLRERAWSEYSYYEKTPTKPIRVTLDLPPLSEARNAFVSIAVCVDKHAVLTNLDTDNGSAEAVGVLGRFMDGLNAAARQIVKDEG